MFNLAILTGRLTADPELKKTSGGVSVCSFTIAVDRRYKQGEDRQTDFINIVAWRSSAEFVSKYFSKGSMIGIEGSIQTRKFVDKDTGKNRTSFEVVANNVQFVESKRSQGNEENNSMPVSKTDPLVEFQDKLDNFDVIAGDEDLPF